MMCVQPRNTEDLAVERERITLLQRFMGDVAHDFKTPLTAIRVSLYLAQRAQSDDERQRHLAIIEHHTARLETLIGDLFNMSRLDVATTNEFQFGRVDVNRLIENVITAQEALASQKQHTIRFERGDIAPLLSDPIQIERVVINLLVNAINYTPPVGEIVLRTFMLDSRLVVECQDNGIGITPADMPHIFDRFYRGDKARSTETGGMGLGLSIVQKIVETHGGQITVTSEPGKGSLFRVSFPATLSQTRREE